MPCNSCAQPAQAKSADPSYKELEAMLCAVVRMLGIEVLLLEGNWKEAGVDPDKLSRWFHEHERKDAARRLEKARRAEAARKKEAALAKLTDEEKSLLGVGFAGAADVLIAPPPGDPWSRSIEEIYRRHLRDKQKL